MRRNNRRRRRAVAQASHDRWLITYADLITLLMIFFVVLYAMSQLDIRKYEILSQTLQQQFRHTESVLEDGSGILDGGQAQVKTPEQDSHASDSEQETIQKEQQLQDLLKVIKQYVNENNLEKEVFVEDTEKGIAIRLSDRFLFDLGKADLKKPAIPVLNKLSTLFAQLDTTISIQGHTDNLPIQSGAVFQDNWGLSAGRALSVLRYFVDEMKLEEKKFEVAGFADTRPIAANDSEANRQKNRRVEILVLR
jgi:chemotaxis protein MotB